MGGLQRRATLGSVRDFAGSMASDLVLPIFRNTLEDLVYDILNEREIPNRTQFAEVRDLINSLRGPVGSATNAIKKLESRIEILEGRIAALESKPAKKAPKKKKAAAKSS